MIHAAAVAIAILSGCPEHDSTSSSETLRIGHALRRERRLEDAVTCYRILTRAHPRFAEGWFELSAAEQDVGDLRAAAESLMKGLKLKPSAPGRLSAYGVLLQLSGRIDEAREAYRRAIAQAPEDAEPHFNLGTLEEGAGEHVRALTAYRQALSLEPPDEARIHNNMGGVLAAMGDVGGALAAYREATEVDPGLADGWHNLGNVMLAQGRYAEAESHVLRALKLSPAHPKAGRKLEHVRAEATKQWQEQVEAEQQAALIEEAARACSDDEQDQSNCFQDELQELSQRLDADGPMVV